MPDQGCSPTQIVPWIDALKAAGDSAFDEAARTRCPISIAGSGESPALGAWETGRDCECGREYSIRVVAARGGRRLVACRADAAVVLGGPDGVFSILSSAGRHARNRILRSWVRRVVGVLSG